MKCLKCKNFKIDKYPYDMWCNQYCLAAPHSEEHIKTLREQEDKHFVKWAESTNNGANCQVSFCGPIGYERRSELAIGHEHCCDITNTEKCVFIELSWWGHLKNKLRIKGWI